MHNSREKTCQEQNCVFERLDCKTCIHEFQCSCSDYSLKRTICTHFHFILTRKKRPLADMTDLVKVIKLQKKNS